MFTLDDMHGQVQLSTFTTRACCPTCSPKGAMSSWRARQQDRHPFEASTVLTSCPSKYQPKTRRSRHDPNREPCHLPGAGRRALLRRASVVRRRRRADATSSPAASTPRRRRGAWSASRSQCSLHALITHDFSLKYVASYYQHDTPLRLQVAALWGGMEGSLLLLGAAPYNDDLAGAVAKPRTESRADAVRDRHVHDRRRASSCRLLAFITPPFAQLPSFRLKARTSTLFSRTTGCRSTRRRSTSAT